MTDTTTGISSEDQAMLDSLKLAYQRIADVFVNASTLAKEVEELRVQVQALKHDAEYARRQNQILDDTLASVQRERDTLRQEKLTLQDRVSIAEHDNTQLRNENASLGNQVADLSQQKAALVRQRDEAELEAMTLREQVSSLNKQRAETLKALGIEVPKVDQPRDEGGRFGSQYDPPIQRAGEGGSGF